MGEHENRRDKKRGRRRRKPLRFRFYKDYDVAQPHAEGFIVMRVFAPIKPIRPDHRILLLRMEYQPRSGKIQPVYTGKFSKDAIRLDDLDASKTYEALVSAKEELHALQIDWDDSRTYRGREFLRSEAGTVVSPEVMTVRQCGLAHRIEVPQYILDEVKRRDEALFEAETEEEAVEAAENLASFVAPEKEAPCSVGEALRELLRQRR